MRCSACGTDNPGGRKFCGSCGAALARACPSCGAANEAQFAFCGECGSRLDGAAASAPERPAEPVTSALAAKPERRLVSVLFADLVGFTTLSEARDPEDVRELLTRYFDACRARITRYGGTVEKFIGDAVMAVWGAPLANEDDAERAVRAALDIVDAVTALGAEIGAPSLAARAAVLTGEAAVNLTATAEGLVTGDLVNSASRVQGLALPGTVLVDDATRRTTAAAMAYAEAGVHELRGKQESLTLWQALRVVAGRGGAHKSAGLEAPFVGRAREFGLVKDLMHTSAEQGVAHLTAVSGVAGVGKSRLAWELFKYVDGLTETMWWHRGRCLAYGEGVTYWALAEMIRGRAGIGEDEVADSAWRKLSATVQQVVESDEERSWVLPRLATLLGLEQQESADAADLFSGWRLFFERMSQRHPVILVFEDLHWADTALLDFIDYLLDWSRNHRIYVVTLARPELAERRPGFGAARRNVTALSLDPLSDRAMDELLEGLVPGLPATVRDRIRERAEGIPLYAVETVRMLVDRGTVVRDGDRYVPVGAVDDLDVPETLQALIAARLDALTPTERSMLQTASVLGKTFTAAALATVSGIAEDTLPPLLGGLVRKELLGVQADPRSPERGQYGFLQSLVQKVAHDTLARRERKALHLAAADYLQRSWGADEGEVVQVVASHYVDAYAAEPDAPDAAHIRVLAQDFLTRAGDRAAALAAQEEAERYYLRAAELTDEADVRADLLLRAGTAAYESGHSDRAEVQFRDAADAFRDCSDELGVARVTKQLGFMKWWDRGDMEGALDLLDEAQKMLGADAPSELRAEMAALRGRLLVFSGRPAEAMAPLDEALDIAEAERLLPILSDALNTKALALHEHHVEESLSLLQGALRVAEAGGGAVATLRAYVNLSHQMSEHDRYADAMRYARQGLALARKVGNRGYEWFLSGHMAGHAWWGGDWDRVEEYAGEIPHWRDVPDARQASLASVASMLSVDVERGRLDGVDEALGLFVPLIEHTDLQERGIGLTYVGYVDLARGDYRQAMRSTRRTLDECVESMGLRHTMLRVAVPTFLEAALRAGEIDAVAATLAEVEAQPVGFLSPFLRGQLARYRARLEHARGNDEVVEEHFVAAERILARSELRYFLAVVRGELAEWLVEQGRPDDAEAPATAALATFEDLGVTPWLARIAALRQPPAITA